MDERCPECGEDVPLVLRGVVTYCAACGTARPALGRHVLGLTGKPAKLGSLAAKLAAGAVFGLGTFIALMITFVVQAIWPEGTLGYAIGGPIEFLILLMAGALFFGGRMLGKASERAVGATRVKALRGLAKRKKGVLRAVDVAEAFNLELSEADALLTRFAKRPDEDVGIDVNDDGEILYLFGNADAKRFRMRVEAAGLEDAFDEVEDIEVSRDEERELSE